MTTFRVHSVKRDNGIIIGVAVFQENAAYTNRLYFPIGIVYHTQLIGKPDKHFVEYIADKNTMLKATFVMQVEKIGGNEFRVIEPTDELQREALLNLPEYVYHHTDAT